MIMDVFSYNAHVNNSSCMETEVEEELAVKPKCWTMDGAMNVLLLIAGCYLVRRNYKLASSSGTAGKGSLADVKQILLQVRGSHLNCRTELLALAELLKTDELANKAVLDNLTEQVQLLSERLEQAEGKSTKKEPMESGPISTTMARSDILSQGFAPQVSAASDVSVEGEHLTQGSASQSVTGTFRSVGSKSKKTVEAKPSSKFSVTSNKTAESEKLSQRSAPKSMTGSFRSIESKSKKDIEENPSSQISATSEEMTAESEKLSHRSVPKPFTESLESAGSKSRQNIEIPSSQVSAASENLTTESDKHSQRYVLKSMTGSYKSTESKSRKNIEEGQSSQISAKSEMSIGSDKLNQSSVSQVSAKSEHVTAESDNLSQGFVPQIQEDTENEDVQPESETELSAIPSQRSVDQNDD